ncbi:hypothetical protein AHAS_Ahas09G0265100 [Arachis hypogaea]|uniref:BHLH domain-containing protein n=1 Tax=Arachis hypogaea TaxID=3818 RepID=A0A445BEB3_ARAHY|nr:hypothetical protein Ahy_A09g041921 [Arachis hypogaea]
MNMMMMQNLIERLRPLVGLNGWDYCVYWKLSEDQRFVEWLGCCCGGTDQNNNVGEDIHIFPCRDTMFSHPRTNHCYLLSQLPTSISIIDSGIHAQTLLTNQPNWVNYSPNILQETIGTQVLIPVPGGLVELFVTKQVPEDHQVIDFVTAQCIVLVEQEAANNSTSFNMQSNVVGDDNNNNHNNNNNENQVMMNNNNNNNNNQFVLTTAPETSPHDEIPITLCSSPLNFMQQFRTMNKNNDNNNNNNAFSEEYQGSIFLHENQNNNNQPMKAAAMEEEEEEEQQVGTKENNNNNKNEGGVVGVGRSDSMSDCSDQNEEEEDGKYRRRNGKGNQSKNLVAERKRRKKLNDRLYNLRSLVPRISKLDRASILGDAIEFVKDLQKQVKDLQDELEDNNNNSDTTAVDHHDSSNQFLDHFGASYVVPNHKHMQQDAVDATTLTMDKQHSQQMEPQVEVAVIDGKEYFVKVFCEHRAGGFVKLMEALNTLGMDVVHATVTSHKGLVSNVFKVEKKDSDMVEAEDVRDSLLELTRNPSCRVWSNNNTKNNNPTSENSNGVAVGRDHHHHHHHHMPAYHPHPFHT